MRLPILVAFAGAAVLAQTASPPDSGAKAAEQKPAGQNLAPARTQKPTGVCAIPLKNEMHPAPRYQVTVPGLPVAPTPQGKSPEVKLPAPSCEERK
jgi:hypothetical protein